MAVIDVCWWHAVDRAVNVLNKETDWEAIVAFCHKVNQDLEGPQTAIRLLVHKIQSPQEREALLALIVSTGCLCVSMGLIRIVCDLTYIITVGLI